MGGDLNGQLRKVHTSLMLAGFTPALRERVATHMDGNQLDQMWVRNMTIRNALVGDPIDQVSDHYPIQVEMEATLVDREQAPQHDSDVVDLRSLP